MKKILVALLFGMMTIGFLTSCGKNSPSDAVKKQMECLKNQDAEGLVELVAFKESLDEEEIKKAKAELASLIREKGFKDIIERNGGIKSYEVLNEDVGENPEPGSIAFVTLKTVYNNGEEQEEKVKLIMDKDGKWKIYMGK